jgi:hypothetical protein
MTELEKIRERLRILITGTCNTIGCNACPNKWPKDSDGNSCQSDYLMMEESMAEQGEQLHD